MNSPYWMIPVAIIMSLLIVCAGCASIDRADNYPEHFYSYATKKYAPFPRVSRPPRPEDTVFSERIISMPKGWFADPGPIDYHWRYPHEPTINEVLLQEFYNEN